MTDEHDTELHRFFALRSVALIEARCRRCGQQVAVYYGFAVSCDRCAADVTDDGWATTGRCVHRPALPDGDELAAVVDVAKAKSPQRYNDERAAHRIRV